MSHESGTGVGKIIPHIGLESSHYQFLVLGLEEVLNTLLVQVTWSSLKFKVNPFTCKNPPTWIQSGNDTAVANINCKEKPEII